MRQNTVTSSLEECAEEDMLCSCAICTCISESGATQKYQKTADEGEVEFEAMIG